MPKEFLPSLRLLVPLSQPQWGMNCSLCDKPQARWTLRVESPKVYICGTCVLYETAWSEANQSAVEAAISNIRTAGKRELPAQGGRLLSPTDADDVLGVVILVDRTLARTGRRR